MRPHLAPCLLCCWTLLGCPSRDNPLDPGRCDPRCTDGQLCFDGQCVDPDGGPAGDGAPGKGPAITYSVRQGSTATATTSWGDIPGLAAQEVTANGKDKYFIILNVPDTWVTSTVHQGGRFQIVDGTTRLSYGIYTANKDNRYPFTLVATKQLSAGTHTIKGQWQASGSSYSLNIGSLGTWLVVVRADEHDLVSTTGSFSSNLLSDKSGDWTDIPGLSVKAEVTGDHLLVLNVPATSLSGRTLFRIVLDDGTSTEIATGSARPDVPGFPSQAMPMTLVGAWKLTAGKRIKAQWKSDASSQSTIFASFAGVESPPWLVALRAPKGIADGYGLVAASISTSSSTYTQIPSISPHPVPVTSVGGNYLFIFSAPCTYVDTASSKLYYKLLVDGAPLAESTSWAAVNWQDIPHTVVGVKALPAGGTYSLSAQWKHSGAGGKAWLGKDARHWLLGLTR